MNVIHNDIIPILREKWNTKESFVKWSHNYLKLKIPKNLSYEKILKKISDSKKEILFCKKAFNCNSLNEIIEKYDILRAMDVFSRDELILIADILSVHKRKWKYNKTTITGLIQSIVNNVTKEDLRQLFERLILEKKIPNLIQHYKWVVGPLGIIRAIEDRRGSEGDDLIELLSKYLIMSTYDEFKKRAKFLPLDFETGTVNDILPIKLQQMLISFGTKNQILTIFNELIEEDIIKINADHDYYVFKVTPCGIFSDITYEPTEELVRILMNVGADALEKELQTDGYTAGSLHDRLIGMIVVTPPESILDKMFGLPDLRQIGKDLGLVRVDKISNKSDLIKYLLIKIGFSMPKRIEGITQYVKILDTYRNQVKNNTSLEKLNGIMTNVYIETEKILKDLIFFHLSCLWPEIKAHYVREKIMEAVHEIVRKEFDGRKDISRYTFAQLIHLMLKMNKYSIEKNKMQKIIRDDLHRTELFPSEDLNMLLQINENRARFTHDAEESNRHENIFQPSEIIGNLLKIAENFQLKKIYPITFRVLRNITNEYNISYLEVIDENEKEWVVTTNEYVEPGTICMMHSSTDIIAVLPLLTTRFW